MSSIFENRIYKQRGDVKGGDGEEGRDKEAGWKEEKEKREEGTNRWTKMWKKEGQSVDKYFISLIINHMF